MSTDLRVIFFFLVFVGFFFGFAQVNIKLGELYDALFVPASDEDIPPARYRRFCNDVVLTAGDKYEFWS